MRWFLSYQGTLFVTFLLDEAQKNQDYLPHWVKAALPILGLVGLVIKWWLVKKGFKFAK